MKIEMIKFCGSHLPILIKIVALTDGPILEIGTGAFSTPFLHWACFDKKRKIVSVENSDEYLDYVKEYESDFHTISKEIPKEKEWDIVFIDGFPVEDRNEQVKNFINTSKYVIVHDTEKFYCDGLANFQKDFIIDDVKTSVLSNVNNLEEIIWQQNS